MKLKYKAGQFVVEPSTTDEEALLGRIADENAWIVVSRSAEELGLRDRAAVENTAAKADVGMAVIGQWAPAGSVGCAVAAGSAIKEWERAVAGSAADLLDGMPRSSARRVLLDVLRRVDENPPVEPGDRFSAY